MGGGITQKKAYNGDSFTFDPFWKKWSLASLFVEFVHFVISDFIRPSAKRYNVANGYREMCVIVN